MSWSPATALIADLTDFWWNERKPDEPMLWDSKIYLGEAFFNEIIRHPVPLDMNTLTALKRSSLGLDLYLWLVYRTFPRATSTSAPGCVPSSTRPSIASSVPLPLLPRSRSLR